MEKRRPHYDLRSVIAEWRQAGDVLMTRSALRFAVIDLELVLEADRVAFAASLELSTTASFYKSMTSNADHRVWQDVYHITHNGRRLYVKITENSFGSLFLMISLKDL